MNILIDSFPRQFACPVPNSVAGFMRRKIDTAEQFYKLLNNHNGIKSLYYSVYATDHDNTFNNVQINKVFFDFDTDDWVFDLLKMHEYCMEKDIRHCFLFSGKKGGHFYLMTKEYENLLNPKQALYNAHTSFMDNLGVKLDLHIRGDEKRVARIPNTWHPSGRRYCIPLTKEDLIKGEEHIRRKALKQQFDFKVYGSGALSMKQFDSQFRPQKTAPVIREFDYDIPFSPKVIEILHPLIKDWLYHSDRYRGMLHRTRYWFAVYCRDMGFPPTLCDEIASYAWGNVASTTTGKTRYDVFVSEQQIEWAYRRKDQVFPNLDTLISQGLVPEDLIEECEQWKKNQLMDSMGLYL